ncbi:uncharacterized protein FA14DRAFT_191767 [Meira miltonrushii]|uniref:Tubby C-terminal domain-containing protein n=1 Tax=Meira miltonrushii TaxID=1280837 RepID=A0A316V595_9BASI|nr:uncharacterized protein FA14DRAFT_191767 [Meira miltonrushii]PWN32686.1 hypothetical protein FA14DRAFT_191767 [Meira miltonrushii]
MLSHRNKTEEYAMTSSSAHSVSKMTLDDGTSTLIANEDVKFPAKNDGLQAELESGHQVPIGLISEYCQHDHVIRFDLQPLLMSWSGLDIVVSKPEPDGSMKKKVSRKDLQPFYIAGKKLISATISDSDHKQIYSLHAKWTSLHTHYYAKDNQGDKVLTLRGEKICRFNLTATFKNAASGRNEDKTLLLKTGMSTKVSELREDSGRLLALIERPSKAKMCLPNEPFRVSIAPKVDTSLVMAICLGMHTQLLTFKIGTYYAPSSAAAAVSAASSS